MYVSAGHSAALDPAFGTVASEILRLGD